MKLTKGEMEAIIKRQRAEIKALRAAGHPLANLAQKVAATVPMSEQRYQTVRDLLEQWDLVTVAPLGSEVTSPEEESFE